MARKQMGATPSNSTDAITKTYADSGTQTLTNKRVNPRVNSTTSSATPAINIDTTDEFDITALAANITSMTTNLTGTPVNGQRLLLRIKDNGTARTIDWGASFTSSGRASLLAATIAGRTHYVSLVYDSAWALWVCVDADTVGYNPGAVILASIGEGNADAADGVTSWTHVVSGGGNRYMLVGLVVSHTGGSWGNHDTYDTKSVSSDLNGAFTFLEGANIGPSGQYTGSALLFGLANPTTGTHTISTNITESMSIAVQGSSVVYNNVASVGTPVVYEPNAAGALSTSVSSTPDDVALTVVAFGNNGTGSDVPPTGFNQTSRYDDSNVSGGRGDYIIIGDAPGAATVNFTSNNDGMYRSAVSINIVRAT